MAKTITFTYNDVEYTLEFNRKSIETLEAQGFVASEIGDKPMTTLPKLFRGAFLAHHKFVKQTTIDEIFEHMGNKDALLEKLAEMYAEPLEALLDEPKEGNLIWGANW